MVILQKPLFVDTDLVTSASNKGQTLVNRLGNSGPIRCHGVHDFLDAVRPSGSTSLMAHGQNPLAGVASGKQRFQHARLFEATSAGSLEECLDMAL